MSKLSVLRTLIILLYLAISASRLLGQPVISGKVQDNRGKPVPGASISLKDSYDGATSDSAGKFQFATTEKGEKLLLVSSIGFNPLERTIIISDKSIELLLQLKESPSELKAVVVTAGSFEASDSKGKFFSREIKGHYREAQVG